MTHHERLITTRADLGRLNADELEAVAYLVAKLLAGSKKHGPLQLASDSRDWPSEMLEEYADALFYAAFASVQRQRRTVPPVANLAGLAARESVAVAMTLAQIDAPPTASERNAYYPSTATLQPTEAERVAMVQFAVRAVFGDPEVTSDAWWQRHPIGSPERVQAVEEHNAAKAVAK